MSSNAGSKTHTSTCTSTCTSTSNTSTPVVASMDTSGNDSVIQKVDDGSNRNEISMNSAPSTSSLSSSFYDVQEAANQLYRGKALAPMVRASTTPLRTLALEYKADLVYTEELVDRSIAQTVRQINTTYQTIDYVKDISTLSQKSQRKLQREGRSCLLLRIDPKLEDQKIVCQLGTGEPDLALKAAKHVYADVAGIDINMGCPKKFSVSGGMGSALLQDPKRAAMIISTLRCHIPRPISCKIRLLSATDPSLTIQFVEDMITAGVNAVAIHARTVGHDAIVPADWKTLRIVLAQLRKKYPTFPFLVNGDFYDRYECDVFLQETKASGVLLGRPALYNTSIFLPYSSSLSSSSSSTTTTKTTDSNNDDDDDDKHKDNTTAHVPLVDKTAVIRRYLQHAARYDQHFKNPKYVVCEMINHIRRTPTPRVPYMTYTYPDPSRHTIANTCNCQTLEHIFDVWNLPWKGVGPKAIETGIKDKGKDNQSTGTSTIEDSSQQALPSQALEPGEHRYDDSYFLKKRPLTDDSCPGKITISDQRNANKKMKTNNVGEEKKEVS